MPRSALVVKLFRFSSVFITAIGCFLAIIDHGVRASTLSMTRIIIICIFLVIITIFCGESISEVYVSLLRWILQRLHTTEDHRWVIALGITAVCDIFMNTLNMVPFIVLSSLSMVMICIVAAGWDSDRSGMTEGLFIGYGKLLILHIISSKLLFSIICGIVVILAIASKLSECVVGATAGDPVYVGPAGSASSTNAV